MEELSSEIEDFLLMGEAIYQNWRNKFLVKIPERKCFLGLETDFEAKCAPRARG